MKLRKESNPKSITGFSLVELLAVVSILVALAYVGILAGFPGVSEQAETTVKNSDMSTIARAFQAVYDDVVMTDAQLTEVSKFGLWPLFQKEHPTNNLLDLPEYDAKKKRGWRGPYAGAEFRDLKIDSTSVGQVTDAAGSAIPGINDPYGGYYRVIMPNAGTYKERRLALVCTGNDEELQTTDTPDANDYIEASGDDTVTLLIPLAP